MPRTWGLSLLFFSVLSVGACSDDSESNDGGGGTGASSAAGGGSSGGTSSGGQSSGGTAPGGAGGTGTGTGGNGPEGTPYVFVGSTDGSLRVYTMNASDGSLSAAGELDTGDGLDFIAVGPDDRTVFVSYDGSVSAFAYDPSGETLTLLDSASTFGVGTHVAVDPTGKFVFVAHYSEGALSFLPYAAGSGFGTATEFSPGDNAHQVRIDAAGTRVYVPCLGSSYVAQYTLDPVGGVLSPQSPATVPAGNGPRHMDFHPSAPVAYVLDELDSEIHVFDIDENGSLVARPSDAVFTSADEQGHQSSDIQVTPDGSFVYAVNRQPSELVTFRVEADHSLTRLGADALTGVVRSFGVDPRGEYLQVGGNDGRLAALRIDQASGAVTETSAVTGLGDIHATVIRYLSP